MIVWADRRRQSRVREPDCEAADPMTKGGYSNRTTFEDSGGKPSRREVNKPAENKGDQQDLRVQIASHCECG
jgi:hypothetical protein